MDERLGSVRSLARALSACERLWETYCEALWRADDVDVYCDAMIAATTCLADHGMGGLALRQVVDAQVTMVGRAAEPFICEE